MRIACKVAYEGTGFSGYQVQPGKRTIQAEIELALSKMHKGTFIRIASSGRTDSFVHAKGQVFHFDTNMQISEERWTKALNALLPEDIQLLATKIAPSDFHARYSAKKKQYIYRVLARKERDVFRRNQTYHVPTPLQLDLMREASQSLLGTHDFSSFCAANTSVVDKVRTIEKLVIRKVDDEIHFTVEGSGFLYNMVRIIVGTLIEVGNGKRKPSEVREILEERDRTKAGKTAPGHGLYLDKVSYEEIYF
ncbi:tRNA pseudouridine synthase A [Bacillus sp. TS-2]|nr:tRNA pseudouridine synthase A [Bacillus sp. TS-2]